MVASIFVCNGGVGLGVGFGGVALLFSLEELFFSDEKRLLIVSVVVFKLSVCWELLSPVKAGKKEFKSLKMPNLSKI